MAEAEAQLRSRIRGALRVPYHQILGPLPVDPTRAWRGTAAAGEPALRLAYYGDCAFRAMDRAHTLDTPVGWPAGLADRLRRRGSALECSVVFMPDYEQLPAREALGQFLRLSGDPEVVVVHTGGVYTRRVILPDTRQIRRLRDDIGRRLGRHVFAAYRLIRPVVRLVGRPVTPYRGRAGLERFLIDAREAWPHAAIVVLAPLRRPRARPEQRRLEARMIADARLAAQAAGVDYIDLSDRVPISETRLRCANGYNLSEAGSELVAELLLEWLDASPRSDGAG